jgi:hypothetical protein
MNMDKFMRVVVEYKPKVDAKIAVLEVKCEDGGWQQMEVSKVREGIGHFPPEYPNEYVSLELVMKMVHLAGFGYKLI